MHKWLKPILCLLLALLCLFSACRRPEEPDDVSEDPEQPEDPIVVYTYHTDVDEEILCTDGAEEYLLLVNKKHPLSQDYEPENLIAYEGKTYNDKDVSLEKRVAQAVLFMTREMAADGVKDVAVTSGYRSYAYQQNLYNNYIALEINGISKEAMAYFGEEYIATNYTEKGLSKLTRADAIRVVDSYSAEAGYSEHQTGLCVDFITSSMTELDRTFEYSRAFAWLKENAYRFGFILRYPEEKEGITGYSYEPWHYRFVGREVAATIHEKGQTLEEFLASR